MVVPRRKSAPLSAPEIIILCALFILHWIIVLGFATYIWWGTPKYDALYIACFAIMVFSWLFFGGCPISVVERGMLYTNAKTIPGFFNPSLQFYQNPSTWTFLQMSIINVLYVVNVAFVLNRLKAHKIITIIVCIALMIILAESRIHEFNIVNKSK